MQRSSLANKPQRINVECDTKGLLAYETFIFLVKTVVFFVALAFATGQGLRVAEMWGAVDAAAIVWILKFGLESNCTTSQLLPPRAVHFEHPLDSMSRSTKLVPALGETAQADERDARID